MLIDFKEYIPNYSSNRLTSEGDCRRAREIFLKNKPKNLIYLLKKRYGWMNNYLSGKEIIYELGCGAGISKFFIKNKNLLLTDVSKFEWVDKYEDALNLSFEDNSVDAFVCSHMIHHLSNPKAFLVKAINCLKPGGIILISDINLSLALKFILRLTHHEGWSYKVNVFSENAICNDPENPWSGNNAIPKLLFLDKSKFEFEFKNARIIHYKPTEFLIFLISGGVISKTKTIQLPIFILNIINKFDEFLVRNFTNLFALGMEIVIEKK